MGGDADARRSRIAGLKRDMLAFVGEAHDGRFGLGRLGEAEVRGGFWVAFSESGPSLGSREIRRRLAGDSSISRRVSYLLNMATETSLPQLRIVINLCLLPTVGGGGRRYWEPR